MKSFKRLRKETSGGGPNTIRFTKYAPHTAYGFKGGKVLARRSGSSSGGDAEELEEQYLAEARKAGTSLENELLGHLSHVKDVPHEDAAHTESALNLLEQFHKLRQGLPSQVTASYKHDGGASVVLVNNNGRIGVSDKHRYPRGIIAYTPEEVDKHFGHAPEYAASLKHFLIHGADIVGRGEELQGDMLYTPNDSHRREMGGVTTYTSNRITYRGKTKAPLGIALHTKVVDGVAQTLTGRRVSKNIYVPEYQYKPDPHNYNLESRNAVEYHLRKAREILQDHDSSHITPEHIERFKTYINSTARTGTTPSAKGYAKFLIQQSQVEIGKLVSEAGRKKKAEQFQRLIDHVNRNAEGFDRSIQLRHHLEKATDHVLNGLQHPDLQTFIDGKPSRGEGVVLAMKDKEGRSRPVSKLVPSEVQRALLNNPRFGRGPIQQSAPISEPLKEKSNVIPDPIHFKYSNVGPVKRQLNERKTNSLDQYFRSNDNTHFNKHFAIDDANNPHLISALLSKKNKFTQKHKEAILTYTAEDSRDINYGLLKKNKKALQKNADTIKDLDSAIASNKIRHDLHTYSSVTFDPRKIIDKKGRMNSPAYISTTHDKDMAWELAHGRIFENPIEDKTAPIHIIHFHLRAGDHAAHISDQSQFPEEHETILGRNTTLQYHKTDQHYYPGLETKVFIHHMSVAK